MQINKNFKEKDMKAYISVNSIETENNISKNEIINEVKNSEEKDILLEVNELNLKWALKIPKINLLARN